jgi:thiamine pyrophosphate-dependent acetolactate synthase large subunit-like protein
VISVSGNGGFLFSAVELETAVRLNCNFVHLVWSDDSYTTVASSRPRPTVATPRCISARSIW